ncbi:MAG: flavin reductase family protein [Acidobacteriota bacterium]
MHGQPGQDIGAIRSGGSFCIHYLSADQRDLSNHFARPSDDRFRAIEYRVGETGVPILDGVIAFVECEMTEIVAGGDHSIVIGTARFGGVPGGRPLAYFHGGYHRLEG